MGEYYLGGLDVVPTETPRLALGGDRNRGVPPSSWPSAERLFRGRRPVPAAKAQRPVSASKAVDCYRWLTTRTFKTGSNACCTQSSRKAEVSARQLGAIDRSGLRHLRIFACIEVPQCARLGQPFTGPTYP